MVLSFAPLEGVTSYGFRNIHHAMFPGCNKYYSPFIAPDAGGNFKAARLRDILPENNRDIYLVPQLLVNSAAAFLSVSREIEAMGYREINLNVGCPSGTVVSKHKGSGMLADLKSLDELLNEIFSSCNIAVSVKTRMGLSSVEEFPAIVEVYNKYPIELLTVHARDRQGQYKSSPAIDELKSTLANIKAPFEYNGNIFTPADAYRVNERLGGIERLMAGRGAVTRPSIFRELEGGALLDMAELHELHDRVLDAFLQDGLCEHFALRRMKELWHYWVYMFDEPEKHIKAVNKSKYLSDYKAAVDKLFSDAGFSPYNYYEKSRY